MARGFAKLEQNDEVVRFEKDLTTIDILSPSEKVLLEILQDCDGVASRSEVQTAWEEREMGWALLNNLGSYSAIIAHIPGGNWALVGHPEAARAAVFRSAHIVEEPQPVSGDVIQPAPRRVAPAPVEAPVLEAPIYESQDVGFATQELRAHSDSSAVLAMRWHERGDLAIVLQGGAALWEESELKLPEELLVHVKNARTFSHPRGEGAAIRCRRGVLDLRAFLGEADPEEGDVVVLQLWPSERTWRATISRGATVYAQ
jgi:hypothetical protein